MRTSTSNGITVKYPDAIGFAFNVCLIHVTGTFAYFTAKVGERTLRADAYNSVAYLDIQELVQSEFDGMEYSVDYTQDAKTQQGRSVQVNVSVYNSEGRALYTMAFSTFYVWGAMFPGETYNAFRTLMYFPGYPFTFGLYTSNAAGKIMVANDGVATSLIDVSGEGVYNFVIPSATAKDYYDIYDMKGTFTETTFDDTFDLTFRMRFTGTQTKKLRIKVCDCRLDKPVYLRWIDRHGFWQHFLFKQGDETRSVSSEGEYMRNNLRAYDGSYGRSGGVGRNQSYSREDSITICAPLVDAETFDLLQDMASSPVLDMYIPEEDKWLSVTAKEGSYTKTDADLQDFIAEIVLPTRALQSL